MSVRDRNRAARASLRDRAAAAQSRYDGSWAGEIAKQLKSLSFATWITMFGASLLWSALPLIILLSSLADERVDDEISRHIGLNSQGAQIVHSLFRGTPAHAVEPILTGLVFSFAGVIAVVSSMQVMYERIFGLEERGRSNLPRGIAWAALLLATVVVDDVIRAPVRRAMGPVVPDVIELVTTTLFFWWSMHFLLAGRATWRSLVRPAVVTGVLWLALALFSSLYFSPLLISDSHIYGTIGVVFSLLTWFFLIGGVVVLGAVLGAAWEARASRA